MPEFFFYAMPKSFSCSCQENGRFVSSLVRESVRGAFPAMIASTIGGANRASRKIIGNMGLFQVAKNAVNPYIMGAGAWQGRAVCM